MRYLSFAESVIAASVQEDVDFIGLSFLAGDHLEHCIITTSLLRDRGLAIPVIVGGVIPRQDIGALKEMGVARVFEAGSSRDAICEYIKDFAARSRTQSKDSERSTK